MIRRQRHLSDDRLIHLCLHDEAAGLERRHLDGCASCAHRRTDIAAWLADCAAAGAADADAAFPADRLARQHARILQRIEHEGRPARVIAFPAGHSHEPPVPRTRPAMRWVAAAAAAGLLIGVLTGHLVHDLSGSAMAPGSDGTAPRVAAAAATQTQTPAVPPQTEEEFLGRIERAAQRSGGPALRPLDDLTPLIWEVAAR